MDTIGQGIIEAIKLIFTADAEIFQIVGLSLYVSFTSVIISTAMGIPLGILIGTYDFKGKGIVVRLIYTYEPASRYSRSYGIPYPHETGTAGKPAAELHGPGHDNSADMPGDTDNNGTYL